MTHSQTPAATTPRELTIAEMRQAGGGRSDEETVEPPTRPTTASFTVKGG